MITATARVTSQAELLLWLSSPHSLSPFPPLLQSHLAHGPVLAKFWNSVEVSHYVYASQFHQSCWTSRRDNPHSLLGDSCSELKCWSSACPPGKLSNTQLATAPHVFLTKWHLEIKERCQLLQSCQGRFSRYRNWWQGAVVGTADRAPGGRRGTESFCWQKKRKSRHKTTPQETKRTSSVAPETFFWLEDCQESRFHAI